MDLAFQPVHQINLQTLQPLIVIHVRLIAIPAHLLAYAVNVKLDTP